MEHRLAEHQRDWDDLVSLDPLWAIASAPERRCGAWGDDEFMATGRRKAAGILRADLVCTALVLQHLPSREHVSRCARGHARLVAPGGVLEDEGLQVVAVHARRRGALMTCTYLAICPGT